MNHSPFSKTIIRWYEENHRTLPWRNTTDPYKIWLSEIILQQTRVAQGLPYYEKFLSLFPTVYDLANAPQDEVMRAWQGLGYYSRARNLYKAAIHVVTEGKGVFPGTAKELQQLPGVGPYTSSAIASFAYNENTAVVDGNVYRVLSRYFGVKDDISSGQGIKVFKNLADKLLPSGKAAIYNQAIMEFGALQCTPSAQCNTCPLSSLDCYAYIHNEQKTLPVKLKKVKVKKRFLNYFIIENGKHLLLKKRSKGDIWEGLYDFPLIESEKELEQPSLLKKLDIEAPLKIIDIDKKKHLLTHQKLFITFIHLRCEKRDFEDFARRFSCSIYDINETDQLPKPILINNYLKENIF